MNSRLLPTLLLLFATVLTGFAPAEEAPAKRRPDIPYMPVSEIKSGMKGYGLTVFNGLETERFDVTIRGVVSNAFADGDMIIAEFDHPLLKDIGVVAGMSGSPVFIDGKIIGAVAYGWGFSVRPVGGITPIENMYQVYDLITDDSQVQPEESAATFRQWPEARLAFPDSGLRMPPEVRLPAAEVAALGLGGEPVVMTPLASPLLVGTRSQLVMDKIGEVFAGSAFQPVMAGVQGNSIGSAEAEVDKMPENGSAFSVLMVTGDLNMAGLGTATVVDGDRLIGFGHPMMGTGAVDMPMALSQVITVVPSVMRPFKLGNAVKEIGALRQDRLPAVGGTLSRRTAMVPLTVNVRASETETDRAFDFRVWNDRGLLPQLMSICFLESMERASRINGPMNMKLDYTVALADGRSLKQSDFLSAEDFVTVVGALQLGYGLDVIMNNRFEPVDIDHVSVNVDLEPRIEVRIIDEFVEGRQTFQPGDTWRGEVRFARWREKPEMIKVEVPLPADLRPGDYEIRIADAGTRAGMETVFHPELGDVESLEDLLKLNEKSFPGDTLYVLLVDPSPQMVLEGQKLPNLPRSVADLTRQTNIGTNNIGSSNARLITEREIPFESMVAGKRTVKIKVEKKR